MCRSTIWPITLGILEMCFLNHQERQKTILSRIPDYVHHVTLQDLLFQCICQSAKKNIIIIVICVSDFKCLQTSWWTLIFVTKTTFFTVSCSVPLDCSTGFSVSLDLSRGSPHLCLTTLWQTDLTLFRFCSARGAQCAAFTVIHQHYISLHICYLYNLLLIMAVGHACCAEYL